MVYHQQEMDHREDYHVIVVDVHQIPMNLDHLDQHYHSNYQMWEEIQVCHLSIHFTQWTINSTMRDQQQRVSHNPK